jgi:hypothetical protein
MDATNWQMLERKARFIAMAMSGDRSIRRIEDVGSNVNQFALAKALASGDDRLMRKAGLDAEVARLERLRDAHIDDQYNIRRTIKRTADAIIDSSNLIAKLEADIARRVLPRHDQVLFDCGGTMITDRKAAGERILRQAFELRLHGGQARQSLGTVNGIDVELAGYEAVDDDGEPGIRTSVAALHHGERNGFEVSDKTRWSTALGRLESSILNLDAELAAVQADLKANERRLPAFEARLGQDFPDAALLEDKLRELAELEADLATTKGEFEPGNDDGAILTPPSSNEGAAVSQAA